MIKRSKYGAIRTTVDGITFDSKAEAHRYVELLAMQRAGLIRQLITQPAYMLSCGGRSVLIRSKGYPNGRQSRYVADFAYLDASGKQIVEDVKGVDTPVSRLKRAIVEAEHGVAVSVVRCAR